MNPSAFHKRWQNLIHEKCPCCDERLAHKRRPNDNDPRRAVDFWECEGRCGFSITRDKYVAILVDEGHIMRRFISRHEAEILAKAIEKSELPVEEPAEAAI